MAWFDVGAGLAEMGKAVAQVSGTALLEQQKSDLDKERLVLANDLASERESKGRKEAHGYEMEKLDKVQTFQLGENEKDRQNRLQTAGIGAGATLGAASMQIEARREEAKLDREFQAEQREKTIAAQLAGHSTVKINEDGTASVVNPATNTATPLLGPDQQPLKFQNPERAKAQAELLTATRDQFNALNRQYEIEMRQAQAELKAAMESIGGKTEGLKDPSVIAAQRTVTDLKSRYEPKINELNSRFNSLSQGLMEKSGVKVPKPAREGGPSLGDFDPANQVP